MRVSTKHRLESERPAAFQLAAVLQWLHAQANPDVREGLKRYAIPTEHALGIKVDVLRRYARTLGRNQVLAESLWGSAIYEARLLAIFVMPPDALNARAMDAWCRDFDGWSLCDTACFDLFWRSPLAWGRVDAWARRQGEFQKRAAFALLAGLAQHDKSAEDERFLARLSLIETAATDERHFVRKGLSWALRGIGKRHAGLTGAVLRLCAELAAKDSAAARALAREVRRELLAKPGV